MILRVLNSNEVNSNINSLHKVRLLFLSFDVTYSNGFLKSVDLINTISTGSYAKDGECKCDAFTIRRTKNEPERIDLIQYQAVVDSGMTCANDIALVKKCFYLCCETVSSCVICFRMII